jgi:hypothetical protein
MLLLFFRLLSYLEIGRGFVWIIISSHWSLIFAIHNHVEVTSYFINNSHWINLMNSIIVIPLFSRTYHCIGFPFTIIRQRIWMDSFKPSMLKWSIQQNKTSQGFLKCHNFSFGFVTKTKAWKIVGQWCNLGVTFAFPKMWEIVTEWAHTLPNGFPLWELESLWSPQFSERHFKGQNSLD